MKQQLTWGAAAAVAIVAAIGISTQSGSKPPATASAARPVGISALQSKAHKKTAQPQCIDSISLLEHFFLHDITAPNVCYAPADQGTAASTATPDPDFQPSFIIATLPDPLHTHFSLLFDRLVEAVQQAAQDEGYDYDSSWLPWDTEESSYALLPDQDEAEERKSKREDQPGILLFRNTNTKDAAYKKALIIFIVGEEPTRGIHRPQFRNAVAWMNALHKNGAKPSSVALLGPTFSGSFPSLRQLLSADDLVSKIKGQMALAVYSGSASSASSGTEFAKINGVDFRSFLQDDDMVLNRFCRYVQQTPNLAILSEDETAYGKERATPICKDATWIYYPRDISTLRAAYQTQSMFSGSAQQNSDSSQRKSLPTDLADPSGQQHDTVRTYAGNQTPLSQEAQLLGIVEALRAHRAHYVVVRSSNTLDPLFLANFLRRDFPEARVAILSSDLLFQRGQDAMALSGVMTLSTYPLFSWARDWTALSTDNSHSHRVFPENSSEGTYIASRLLLQSLARADHRAPALSCEPSNADVFVPPLRCQPKEQAGYVPLPDYAPPFWTDSNACDASSSGTSCRPATWLSVITRNGTWPLAALNDRTLQPRSAEPPFRPSAAFHQQPPNPSQPSRWHPPSRSIRILLIGLCALALFHSLCCGFASFTAKPAFRAHFASAGRRHTGLVLIGSYLIALMALLTGWGCGIFSATPTLDPPTNTLSILTVVLLVCVVAALSIVANVVVTKRLNGSEKRLAASSVWRLIFSLLLFTILVAAFFRIWVQPIEGGLLLASRAFSYFRSMNLTSGASPIVPFLSLIVGLYLWFWYALHGLALFGPDRPCLPPEENLAVKVRVGPRDEELKLSMFSQERAADPAELIAAPLAWGNLKLMLVLFGLFAVVVACLVRDVPVRSLGSVNRYARIFCFSLDFYFSLILAEACQIWRTWSSVRQLLVFLDRLALRRTLGSLHGFSWGSVWKMSGNVLDVRYKLLSRQLECLTHLHNSLNSGGNLNRFAGANDCVRSVTASRLEAMKFSKWYSENYHNPNATGLQAFRNCQKQIAKTTGVVLTELLLPASRLEKHSLIQVDPTDKRADDRRTGPAPSANELIRNAEELVCLTYLGYAQNLLGRIRTIVLGGVYLFLGVTIAVSSYPFDPRPLLSGALLFLFFAFGGVVVFAYADMHRDATLSHLTNTKPGELGSEFWFKVIGLGAAPLLGLITQIFPEWSGFLFSWLQPGLSSLK